MEVAQKPDYIGKGSYGCAFKYKDPYFQCEDSFDGDYKGKVIKGMTTKDAKDEYTKYNQFKDSDGKFPSSILETKLCKMKKDQIDTFKQHCQATEVAKETKDDFSLLIIKDGGIDLTKFIDFLFTEGNTNKRDIVINFWKNSFTLLLALDDFSCRNIIHGDIKANNILYDVDLQKFSIIDFSFTKNFRDFDPVKYYSYLLSPLECHLILMNGKFKEDFSEDFILEGLKKKNKKIENYTQYKYLVSEIQKTEDISDKFNPDEINYDDYIKLEIDTNITARTYDSYDIGMSLMYVLARSYEYLDINFVNEMSKMLYSMFMPDPSKRAILTIELYNKYNEILKLLDDSPRKPDDHYYEGGEDYSGKNKSLNKLNKINQRLKSNKTKKNKKNNYKKTKRNYSRIRKNK